MCFFHFIFNLAGDLTDAKTKDYIGSTQHEIEWKSYRSAIKLAQADEKTVWIDIRGNHGMDWTGLKDDRIIIMICHSRRKTN